jgi:hypothetical protein
MSEKNRKEYKREWARKNKDRIKDQRRENARRKILETIESIEKLDDTHFLITDKYGNKYAIGNKD